MKTKPAKVDSFSVMAIIVIVLMALSLQAVALRALPAATGESIHEPAYIFNTSAAPMSATCSNGFKTGPVQNVGFEADVMIVTNADGNQVRYSIPQDVDCAMYIEYLSQR